MNDPLVERLSAALAPVRGLAAFTLGGSRARGTAGPAADYDFGLYYEAHEPLRVEDLRAAIAPLVDDSAKLTLTEIGGWGPWINGGGWLSISGRKVDLLYRDLNRVRAVVADCAAGRVEMHYQPGHPHGFCSAIWMGEAALCLPLRDEAGAIAALIARASPYPDALRQALIARFHGEARFSIDNAETALPRGDETHVAGCAYRALCCLAQVLFALNRRYLINEKGALAEAAGFPVTIETGNAARMWAAVGAGDLEAGLRILNGMAGELDGIVAAG